MLDALPPQPLLYVALIGFWVYSLWLVRRGGYYSGSAVDYFVANRNLSHFRYSTSVAFASTLGWLAFDFPTALMQEGYAASALALACIVIPLGGILLSRRQWLVSRRYGFVTPGEWLAQYFQSKTLQPLVLLITALSTLTVLCVQWQLGAELLSLFSGGWLSTEHALWVFSGVMLLCSALGGLAGVVRVESRLFWICGAGLIWLALWIWIKLQGSDFNFIQNSVQLALIESSQSILPPDSHPLERYSLLVTLLLALLGVHALPAFSMAVFASRSPLPFMPQQLWLSAIVCGALLVGAGWVIGIGSHFLGANAAFTVLYPEQSLSLLNLQDKSTAHFFAQLAQTVAQTAPWAMAMITLVLMGILQGSTLLFLNTCASSLVRDGIVAHLAPKMDEERQRRWSIYATGFIGAIVLGFLSWHGPLPRVALLTAFTLGTHLLPAWLGALYFPRLTRRGICWGLLVGLSLQLYSLHNPEWLDAIGITGLSSWYTVFALFANVSIVLTLSLLLPRELPGRWRWQYHEFIRAQDSLRGLRRWLAPLAWCLLAQWVFFAFGPGRALGERWLGHPDLPEQWLWGLPPTWLWLLLCWLMGLFVLAFLGYTLNVSGLPKPPIKRLQQDWIAAYRSGQHL